jgi:hypothetical protein
MRSPSMTTTTRFDWLQECEGDSGGTAYPVRFRVVLVLQVFPGLDNLQAGTDAKTVSWGILS